MLCDMEFGGSFVNRVWYPDFYHHVRRNIPGSDWGKTPFRVIRPAVGFYPEEAAKFLGLIYCAVAIERPELWGSHHAELNGIPIRGRTYYRLNR